MQNRFGCQPSGAADAGEACSSTQSGDTCQAGLFCYSGKCERFCDPGQGATACPTGHSCSLQITWNGGPPNGERFSACVRDGDDCDVVLQTCADASQGCFATTAGNKCLTPGAVADGQTCAKANDCKKGSSCYDIGSGFKCYALCRPAPADGGTADAGTRPDGGAALACATGTCDAVVGGYGVCR